MNRHYKLFLVQEGELQASIPNINEFRVLGIISHFLADLTVPCNTIAVQNL